MAFFSKKKRDVADIEGEIKALQDELELLRGPIAIKKSKPEPEPEPASVAKESPPAVPSSHSPSNALFTTLSHELRTPLNGVLGMAQLLKEEIDSPKLETLESCAQHMLSVLHTLVNLSKIQSLWGDLPEHREWINLQDMMEQIKKNVARRALSRRLTIQLKHANDRVRLRGDYDHLIHIIEMAILGSLECTDIFAATEVQVMQISWDVTDENVTIVIENPLEVMPHIRGVRIAEVSGLMTGESSERIRMEFLYWAVSVAMLQHYHGGMIATKMDGPIGVHTKIAFKMEIMVASPSKSRPIGGLSLDSGGKAPNALLALPFSLNVLVVEDDPVNQELMTLLLERIGQKIEIARNGQAALDLLYAGAVYDLILMDIDMPIMDGMTTTRAIRMGEGGEHAVNTPIVAVTAFNTLSDQSKFKKAGMGYFLSKPVSLKDLRSILLDVNRKDK